MSGKLQGESDGNKTSLVIDMRSIELIEFLDTRK